jgi:hypothetical protein
MQISESEARVWRNGKHFENPKKSGCDPDF